MLLDNAAKGLTCDLWAKAATRPASRAVEVLDFELVPYQGAEVLGGREAKFSKVFDQGKPVVLNFWAGNCPPCRVEMPSFQKVAEEYDGRVIFVGLDVGVFTGLGDEESARRLLDELEISYPSAYATDASPLRKYKVVSMPTTVFLDSRGKVLSRWGGIITEDDLRDMVQQLVTQP
ncbi:MAG: TlpA family protein disulfide reductase [Chloroflexota bacterium]|nr:TlpA family protein disulfide reductase [Chloroflexota bacterium]